MNHNAQGFVEVTGYAAAIEVADAMAKSAQVTIVMAHPVDGPDVCVICEGDVAACQAAVNAGKAVAEARGQLMAVNVIPRPDPSAADTATLMAEMRARKAAKVAERRARRSGPNAPLASAPMVLSAPLPAESPESSAGAAPENGVPAANTATAPKPAARKKASGKKPKK